MLALMQSSWPKRTMRMVLPLVWVGPCCKHTWALFPTWKVRRVVGWSWERLWSSQVLYARTWLGWDPESDSLQRMWNSWQHASSPPLPLKHPWSQDADHNDSVVCLAVAYLVFLERININTFFCISFFFCFPLPIVMPLISLSVVRPQHQRKLWSLIPSLL